MMKKKTTPKMEKATTKMMASKGSASADTKKVPAKKTVSRKKAL